MSLGVTSCDRGNKVRGKIPPGALKRNISLPQHLSIPYQKINMADPFSLLMEVGLPKGYVRGVVKVKGTEAIDYPPEVRSMHTCKYGFLAHSCHSSFLRSVLHIDFE